MSDKPDVAALTDAIEKMVDAYLPVAVMRELQMLLARCRVAAAYAANVPADVAALIARLREHNVTTCSNYAAEAWKDIRQAAAALQSQQERIAELEIVGTISYERAEHNDGKFRRTRDGLHITAVELAAAEAENAALRALLQDVYDSDCARDSDEELHGRIRAAIDAARAKPNVPYPEFCRHPDKCAGRSTCPRDPCCCD